MDTAFLNTLADGIQEFHEAAYSHDPSQFDAAEQALDSVLSEARSQGVTRISNGGGREVFRGGSIAGESSVIKVEMGGSDENRDAVATWQSMDKDARACVAPITGWADDYRWIVQRKAGAGTPGSLQTILEQLADAGWGLVDQNLENVGTLDGRPVVIDLGRLYQS